MENFKVKEYFKDYISIQKEFFSDLKQVTEPKKLDGKLTSIVLLNGEEYEKIDWIKDNLIHILFLPQKTYQISPIIELIASDKDIKIETHKIIKGHLLEYREYWFYSSNEDKEVVSSFRTQFFDISDELDKKRYVFKHLLEKSLEGKTSKKLVGERFINAKRNEKRTMYVSSLHGLIIDDKVVSNKNISCFELLSNIDKQIAPKNKTK